MLALRLGLLQLHHRVNEHLLGDWIGPHPYIDAGQGLLRDGRQILGPCVDIRQTGGQADGFIKAQETGDDSFPAAALGLVVLPPLTVLLYCMIFKKRQYR